MTDNSKKNTLVFAELYKIYKKLYCNKFVLNKFMTMLDKFSNIMYNYKDKM